MSSYDSPKDSLSKTFFNVYPPTQRETLIQTKSVAGQNPNPRKEEQKERLKEGGGGGESSSFRTTTRERVDPRWAPHTAGGEDNTHNKHGQTNPALVLVEAEGFSSGVLEADTAVSLWGGGGGRRAGGHGN